MRTKKRNGPGSNKEPGTIVITHRHRVFHFNWFSGKKELLPRVRTSIGGDFKHDGNLVDARKSYEN